MKCRLYQTLEQRLIESSTHHDQNTLTHIHSLFAHILGRAHHIITSNSPDDHTNVWRLPSEIPSREYNRFKELWGCSLRNSGSYGLKQTPIRGQLRLFDNDTRWRNKCGKRGKHVDLWLMFTSRVHPCVRQTVYRLVTFTIRIFLSNTLAASFAIRKIRSPSWTSLTGRTVLELQPIRWSRNCAAYSLRS